MNVTKKWLQEHDACAEGMRWCKKNDLFDSTPRKFIEALIEGDHVGWASWLIARLLDHDGQIKYAIFAAEQVLHIFEKKYPDDKRPRKAIEAAKHYLETHSAADRKAADAAADAAAYAAYAADAARDKMKISIVIHGLSLLEASDLCPA